MHLYPRRRNVATQVVKELKTSNTLPLLWRNSEKNVFSISPPSEFVDFCTKLRDSVAGKLHLWATRVYHDNIPPFMTEAPLSEPLRSPGAVVREVQASDLIQKYRVVRGYKESSIPCCSDGPLPLEISHQGPNHGSDVTPMNCEACGVKLAGILKELHVGGERTLPSRLCGLWLVAVADI